MYVLEAYKTHAWGGQRNLNNVFAYDLVPSPAVIVAALKAARRVNDFPTAVRIFEGAQSPALLALQEGNAIIGRAAKKRPATDSTVLQESNTRSKTSTNTKSTSTN